MGLCWAWSVCLTRLLLGRLSPRKRLTCIMHILSPETYNCPSWISRRNRMTIENISLSISTKECCWPSRGWTCNLLITTWTVIQLSHRGYLPTLLNLSTTATSLQQPDLCIPYLLIRRCLFVLRFYGPVNPMGSCRAWSVYLTTRLLGRLSPLSG